ncbi:hypothetical protein AB0C69_37985, partial [Actinomadura sp. NPDC048032]|uniref:hypothetical protein n=1 Tax=Actinomadura sp. NPDC048032 TaxID=3155747 RepID=UPI0033F59308
QELHTDVSSLVQVTFRFQRLLDEFTFSGDEEAGGRRGVDRRGVSKAVSKKPPRGDRKGALSCVHPKGFEPLTF